MHYSHDFAQQVHFPNNPLQPGPAYFLTARKCQIFGVACEPLGWQVNYLIDEADVVHHFFEARAEKGKEVYLHADNCVGQNKNNATMQYLAWRGSSLLYPRASNPIDRLQVEDMEDSVNEDSPMSSHQLQYCCHTVCLVCLVTLPLIQVQVRIPQQIPC